MRLFLIIYLLISSFFMLPKGLAEQASDKALRTYVGYRKEMPERPCFLVVHFGETSPEFYAHTTGENDWPYYPYYIIFNNNDDVTYNDGNMDIKYFSNGNIRAAKIKSLYKKVPKIKLEIKNLNTNKAFYKMSMEEIAIKNRRYTYRLRITCLNLVQIENIH